MGTCTALREQSWMEVDQLFVTTVTRVHDFFAGTPEKLFLLVHMMCPHANGPSSPGIFLTN